MKNMNFYKGSHFALSKLEDTYKTKSIFTLNVKISRVFIKE
ncbi:hypothetical protein PH505_aq00390 [Pseudoalteromonas distincta]|nr:hypothetical protein PH505_aq00390 [Pseudoalteromonas distincta]